MLRAATISVAAAPPPPPVNGRPPNPPGEFAFQNCLNKAFLSTRGGTLGMSATRGESEKFRIVPERGTTFERIQSLAGAYLQAKPAKGGQSTPASLSTTTNEYTLFDILFTGPSSYGRPAEIRSKNAPTYSLAAEGQQVSASNLAGVATKWFWVMKCGDLGPMLRANLRPVGTTTPSPPVTLTRQGDGSYAIYWDVDKVYWSATRGGGNSGVGGSDGNPFDYKTSVGENEKFKFIDQGNCTYAIQTAKGWHVGIKNGGWKWEGLSTRISDPNAAPSIGYTAYWEVLPTSI
jgi:hypothetical protein